MKKISNERKTLFKKVLNIIDEHAESIIEENGIVVGIATNSTYDDGISFVHTLDDTIELYVNDENVLKIGINSPVLEIFQELFNQLKEDDY